MRRGVIASGVFGVVSVFVAGIAVASRSDAPARPPVDTRIPAARSTTTLPPGTTTATQMATEPNLGGIPAVVEGPAVGGGPLEASNPPALQIRRLELATRLAVLGPGGPRADEANGRGARISGVAVTGSGIFVALISEASKVPSMAVVGQEIDAILVARPELADFGVVTYTVMELSVDSGFNEGG